LSGIHGKWCYWAGVGSGQTSSGSTDGSKVNTPWWWRNQPDNFGLPETPDGTKGVAYEPLKIVKAEVVSNNEVHVYFNREISTISAVMQNRGSERAVTSSNFKIYLDGKEVPFTSVVTERGYLWKSIRLVAAEKYLDANNRWSHRNYTDLDNGNPYGLAFQGFTQKDIDERKIDKGGWMQRPACRQDALKWVPMLVLKTRSENTERVLQARLKLRMWAGATMFSTGTVTSLRRAKLMPYSNRGSVMFTGPLLQAFIFTSTPR
jgi:hypothetical protein